MKKSSEGKTFILGIGFSVILHCFLLLILTASSWWPSTKHEPKVYSVTIEGGKQLGGITQAPKDAKKAQPAPPKKRRLSQNLQKKAKQLKKLKNLSLNLKKKQSQLRKLKSSSLNRTKLKKKLRRN